MKTKAKRYGVRYPWTDWFLKDQFVLRRGRDFHCSTSSIALMTRRNAKDRGVKVNVVIPRDGEVRVTVTGRAA